MVREFSEEKKEELYRILTSLDDSLCGSFLEWCGSRRYEFGDWMDRLSIPSYMGKIDQFETRITDMNASIRSQIDTVFSNVYAIDRKYGEIFQNYAEIVKGQKQLVDDMREMLRSGNFDKKGSKRQMSTIDEGIDKWLEAISIEGFESRLGMYRHGEQYGIDYEELQAYLRSMLEEHIITQSEYDYLSRIIINYGHVPSSVEETITRDINELLANRKQLITSVDEKIEEARLSMSSDNPRAIVEYRLLNEYRIELLDSTVTIDELEEVVDILQEKHPQMFKHVGILYVHSPGECEKLVQDIINEYRTLTTYVNEENLEGLDWDIEEAKTNLGKDFIVVLRREMLKNGITSEMSVECFLVAISVETEHGNKLLEDDYGDETYFETRYSYDENTRGAGLIHVTGETQKVFLDYLIDNAEDQDEKEILQTFRDGYYQDGTKCRNDVKIDGLSVSEYIAKYYPIDSAIWFWGDNDECMKINEENVSIDEFASYWYNKTDGKVLCLVTQYAVNGSEFKPQAFEKMCGAPDNVIIENGTVYFTEYVDGTEIKWEADIPNGWYNREKLFEEMEEI